MIINHNIAALNTVNQLAKNDKAANNSLAKLSSGLRINSAADDAAGLAISEKMKGQISGLDQASRNAQDGISMVQTAEGALNETTSILQRMRELATQSANDTNTATDRQSIQAEVDQLSTEITRISNTTQFNGQTLLNGAMNSKGIGADTLQIGANTGQTMSISIDAMDAQSLGVARNVSTASTTTVAGAVASVSYNQSSLGANVVNGATISATYTAATPATAGVYTLTAGTAGTTTGQTISIDGVSFTAASGTSSSTTFDNTSLTTQANTLAAAINGNTTLSAKYTASVSGNNVVLTQKAGQESSTAPVFTTSDTTANKMTESTTTAGVAGVGAKVTLTDGTHTDTISISDATATSFSASPNGSFSGLTFNLTGAISTLPTSGTTSSVTVGVSTTTATAAKFVNGVKTADAVAAGGIDVSSSATAASNAITTLDNAINTVSAERGKLGAIQNRLDHTINNLDTSSQNLSSAESQITDVDMAKEMMTYTKDSILQQAAQSMLAKANQAPQGVLQLLR